MMAGIVAAASAAGRAPLAAAGADATERSGRTGIGPSALRPGMAASGSLGTNPPAQWATVGGGQRPRSPRLTLVTFGRCSFVSKSPRSSANMERLAWNGRWGRRVHGTHTLWVFRSPTARGWNSLRHVRSRGRLFSARYSIRVPD